MASSIVQLARGTTTAISAWTIVNLASDTNLLTGRQSDAIDLTASNYANLLRLVLSGVVKSNHTTPTAGVIEVWGITPLDDSTWPDTFGASDAAVTATSRALLGTYGRKLFSCGTTTTIDQPYPTGDIEIGSFFNGAIPKKMVFFLTHSMVQNTNATASTSIFYLKPSWETVG